MSLLFLLGGHGHVDWSSFTVMEWIAVGASALFVAWSIWRAVDLTVHPGETEPDHIKRMILQEPTSLDVAVSLKRGDGGTP